MSTADYCAVFLLCLKFQTNQTQITRLFLSSELSPPVPKIKYTVQSFIRRPFFRTFSRRCFHLISSYIFVLLGRQLRNIFTGVQLIKFSYLTEFFHAFNFFFHSSLIVTIVKVFFFVKFNNNIINLGVYETEMFFNFQSA